MAKVRWLWMQICIYRKALFHDGLLLISITVIIDITIVILLFCLET